MKKHRSIQSVARRSAVHAFTVIELLVVIVIILIVLSITTPAFRAMIYSSERSLAFNTVEASVASARDLALRSAGGDDGAVVFLFDQGGPLRIIPAIRVGTIVEPAEAGRSDPLAAVTLDVFAPVPDVPPVEMPRNWHVRGYAPAGSMQDLTQSGDELVRWYNSQTTGGTNFTDRIKLDRNWIFPESGFYATDFQVANGSGGDAASKFDPRAVTARQSFMVRFDGRTGALSPDRGLALFIDPRPSSSERVGDDRPRARDRWLRVDRAESLTRWAQGILNAQPFDAQTGQPTTGDDGRFDYISSLSNDVVLVKPVTRLAVYDERRLATGIGARGLNRDTGSLYQPVDRSETGSVIGYDEALWSSFDADRVNRLINQWIEGDTAGGPNGEPDGTIDAEDEPEARLYMIRSGTGELVEVVR